jgi:hypothetical protein
VSNRLAARAKSAAAPLSEPPGSAQPLVAGQLVCAQVQPVLGHHKEARLTGLHGQVLTAAHQAVMACNGQSWHDHEGAGGWLIHMPDRTGHARAQAARWTGRTG